MRAGVGAGVALLAARGVGRVRVDGCGAPDAAAEAAELAAWRCAAAVPCGASPGPKSPAALRFQEFKSCGAREPEATVALYEGAGDGDEDAARLWGEGAILGRAQNWARFLSDMPANEMAPVDLAQAALDVLCPLGVRVEARDREWIEAQHMQALLAVARGSCEEPMFLECAYDGKAGGPPVLLAAKGITFDR